MEFVSRPQLPESGSPSIRRSTKEPDIQGSPTFSWKKLWNVDKLKAEKPKQPIFPVELMPNDLQSPLNEANVIDGQDTDMMPVEFENENDMSSLDSFPLVESTEATSSFSHFSSNSSVSGLFKSPKSTSESAGTMKKEKRHNKTGSGYFKWSDSKNKSSKKEYMKLLTQCLKFKQRNNAVKANYLRLTLLPFLRQNNVDLLPANNQIDLPVKVFATWWTELLEVLKSNFKNISGVDKDAFYEAVSSLISRPEWLNFQDKPIYQQLLQQTFVHVIYRCATSHNLSISQAAFTGKVIAYAYSHVPHVSTYLINLLRITASSVKRLGSVTLEATTPALNSMKYPEFNQHLVDARRKPSTAGLMQKMSWFPFESCKSWARFFLIDSPLFSSFFKHLCTLQTQYLPIINNDDIVDFSDETKNFVSHSEAALLTCPGMRLILASIVTHLDRVLVESNRSVNPRTRSFSSSSQQDALEMANSRSPNDMPSSVQFNSQNKTRGDHMKIFVAIRELLHAEELTIPYVLAFSRTFDRVFRAFAVNVKMYNIDGCVTVCDVVEEWISSVFAVKSTKSYPALMTFKSFAIDWNFWFSIAKCMLKTENIHTEIRAISFLYNVWPYVPNNDSGVSSSASSTDALISGGLHPTERKSSMTLLTDWILSTEIWLQLFCHWSPLVRSYYHRLLCYRIASVGEDSGSWFLEAESAQYIAESRKTLQRQLAQTYLWCEILSENTRMKPETAPSLPMPRMRVGVRKVGTTKSNYNAKSETNVNRIFPFDVFDTFAYWQRDASLDDNDNVATPPSSFKSVPSDTDMSPVVKNNLARSLSGELTQLWPTLPSEEETQSIRSVSSQSHKPCETSDLKTSQTDAKTKNSPASLTRSESSPQMGMKNSPLQKHWSNLRKLIKGKQNESSQSPQSQPSNNSYGDKQHKNLRPAFDFEETSSSTSSKCTISTPAKESPAKKSSEKHINVTPVELTQQRPEVIRPSHRFIMIPTNMRPPLVNEISHPKLPFSSEINIDNSSFDCSTRKQAKDLSIWNYSGRSLAEWNMEVSCFEGYARLQEKTFHETLEMFTMPSLAAEIPWRTVGLN